MNIERQSDVQTATIANGATTSSAIKQPSMAFGAIILPAAFTGTALTFTVCDTFAGTYTALYDDNNAAVGIAVVAQGRAYPLPAELSGERGGA